MRLLIIARESKAIAGLHAGLVRNSFACSVIAHDAELTEHVSSQSPDLVLVEVDGHSPGSGTWELVHSIKQEKHRPTLALVPDGMLNNINGHLNADVDDFLASPYDVKELILRINRLLHKSGNASGGELIECDGLVIDLARCEVALDGRVVDLTFREYELLKFLAGNRGRVYTRGALLDRVWGYDYYGGDRTVDVHIRRLRSKIEGSKYSFIETVRNIGYRFIKNSG